MFNRLKKWFFEDYEAAKAAASQKRYMTRKQLDKRSRAADESMVKIQLSMMTASQRYKYHVEELRWRLMVGLAPDSHHDEIRAKGHEALAELRRKYATFITLDII